MAPIDIFPQVVNVIEHVRRGKTLTLACHDNFIAISTFKRYVGDHRELQELYDEALNESFDVMADKLLDLHNDPEIRKDAKMATVISANLRWYLSRKRPEQYGEKVTHNHLISADQAILEAMAAGTMRATQSVIEGVMIDVTPKALPAPETKPASEPKDPLAGMFPDQA